MTSNNWLYSEIHPKQHSQFYIYIYHTNWLQSFTYLKKHPNWCWQCHSALGRWWTVFQEHSAHRSQPCWLYRHWSANKGTAWIQIQKNFTIPNKRIKWITVVFWFTQSPNTILNKWTLQNKKCKSKNRSICTDQAPWANIIAESKRQLFIHNIFFKQKNLVHVHLHLQCLWWWKPSLMTFTDYFLALLVLKKRNLSPHYDIRTVYFFCKL